MKLETLVSLGEMRGRHEVKKSVGFGIGAPPWERGLSKAWQAVHCRVLEGSFTVSRVRVVAQELLRGHAKYPEAGAQLEFWSCLHWL